MSGDAESFRVSYSESVRIDLRAMVKRALEAGLGGVLRAALQAIDARLKQDPRSFGEPKYRYKNLKLVLHSAIYSPLVVHFTVHEELPLVFVESIQPLPRQGF
jgi:hypothetical protein